MIVSDTAVKKSVTVMVLACIIIVAGVYSYLMIPRENDPDITIPYVFVSTSYRGVSPTDIESGITIEIEKKLKGLEGVKKIQSVSSEGLSSINLEFVTGTDIEKALQDVKDKVDEAKGELPDDLESDPAVFEVNLSELPIGVYSLYGTCGLPCLKDIADDLKDEIEAVPGVLEAEITGGLEREIRVEVIPDKLTYYGLSIASFQEKLFTENRNTSGGSIRMGDGRFQLQVPGEFKSPAEIYGLVMGTHNGQPVYLKDVATVVDGFKEETSRSRLDGRDAISIGVKKRSGENIIAISDRVDALIDKAKNGWPQNTGIVKVMDKAADTRNMVADLENNILSGLALVVIVLSAFALLILLFQGWMLAIGLEKPIEFFPNLQPKSMYVNVEPPEGADLEYIDGLIQKIEVAIAGGQVGSLNDSDEIMQHYEKAYTPKEHQTADGKFFMGPSDLGNIRNIYTKAVNKAGGESMFSTNAPNNIGIRFLDLAEQKRPATETMDEIRKRLANIAGAKITIAAGEEGPATGSPINIEVSGDEFEVLGKLSKQIREVIAKIPHVTDVRDNYSEGTPAIQVVIDRQKAALFGLTTDMIGFALKTAYNGMDVSTFRESNKDYDITVQLPEKDRRLTNVLRELMIPVPSGEMVPLSTLAEIQYTGTIGDIVRVNNRRVVTIEANVDETRIPGPVARAQAEALLNEFSLPSGYGVKFTGELEMQKESEDFLMKAFVIALFLIFFVLVSQFNSITLPFVIMTSVILSLGGAFLGLAIFQQPFGIIMTSVGVISLAGVVVNNAIVLVDYINKLRDRGMETQKAVISAGATRLRPVILTAVTTILGLLPMVTGISFDFHNLAISWVSESSQWWRSMAVVVIFGLMVATFLTLVVVPSLYALLEDLRGIKEKISRQVFQFAVRTDAMEEVIIDNVE